MATGSPVRGLRPVRAARSLATKLPKPDRATVSPVCRASVMVPSTASTARAASDFASPVRSATASINSFLFTAALLFRRRARASVRVHRLALASARALGPRLAVRRGVSPGGSRLRHVPQCEFEHLVDPLDRLDVELALDVVGDLGEVLHVLG